MRNEYPRIILPAFGQIKIQRSFSGCRHSFDNGSSATLQAITECNERYVIKAAEAGADVRAIFPVAKEKETNSVAKVTSFRQQALDQYAVQGVTGLDEDVPSSPLFMLGRQDRATPDKSSNCSPSRTIPFAYYNDLQITDCRAEIVTPQTVEIPKFMTNSRELTEPTPSGAHDCIGCHGAAKGGDAPADPPLFILEASELIVRESEFRELRGP